MPCEIRIIAFWSTFALNLVCGLLVPTAHASCAARSAYLNATLSLSLSLSLSLPQYCVICICVRYVLQNLCVSSMIWQEFQIPRQYFVKANFVVTYSSAQQSFVLTCTFFLHSRPKSKVESFCSRGLFRSSWSWMSGSSLEIQHTQNGSRVRLSKRTTIHPSLKWFNETFCSCRRSVPCVEFYQVISISQLCFIQNEQFDVYT